jgi:hypothetical protein
LKGKINELETNDKNKNIRELYRGIHHIQNGSGAHPVSYPMDVRGSFPGGKASRA